MLVDEAKQLVSRYASWIKDRLDLRAAGEFAIISTPFLDPHNDEIELYLRKQGDAFVVTDAGETLSDLEDLGLEISTEKRKLHLEQILNGFGVMSDGRELFVRTSEQDFPQRKHNLIQAVLAVHDLYLTGQAHVQQFFTEDVALFLKSKNIPFFRDLKLSGRSGFDHHFDFGFPAQGNRPEGVLLAVNSLTRDKTTSTAFSVHDVRLGRGPLPIRAYALINDVESKPSPDHLDALRNYDIVPLRWSKREEATVALAG
jgi:hypothetical protein